jgi:hypothetical protein
MPLVKRTDAYLTKEDTPGWWQDFIHIIFQNDTAKEGLNNVIRDGGSAN